MTELTEKVRQHASQTLCSINEFRKKLFICDFTIKVGEVEFPVHRNVIAACSEYFQAMFSSNMKEVEESKVDMKEVEPDAVKECIEFMYTGEASVTMENAQHILHASGLMQLNKLQDLCLLRLQSMVHIGNCFELKKVAKMYGSEELEKLADDCIVENLDAAVNDKNFLEVEQKDILKYVNACKDHLLAWEALMTWLKYEKKPRTVDIANILKEIDYKDFPFDFIMEMLQSDDIVGENEDAISLLADILCEKIAQDSSVVNSENCIKVKLLFRDIESSLSGDAEKYTDEVVAKHFYDVHKREDFLELSADDITFYLHSPFTNSISEVVKWNAVLCWVKHDSAKREEDFYGIFQYLHVNNFSTPFIRETILNEQLVKDSHQCKDILINALCDSRKSKNPWIVLINKTDYTTTLFHAATKQPFWQNSDIKIPIPVKPGGSFGLAETTQPFIRVVVANDDIYCQVGDILYCLEIQSRQNWFQVGVLEDKLDENSQLCTCGNKIYVIGTEIMYFDLTQNIWKKGNARYKRIFNHCVVSYNEIIYVIGGNKTYLPNAKATSVGEAEKFVSNLSLWSSQPQMAQMHKKRVNSSACELHGLIYVFGGDKRATVEFYNPTSNVWTLVAKMNVQRSKFYSGVLNGKIYVMGGKDPTEIYDEEKNEWKEDNGIDIGSNIAVCVELD